MTKKFTWVFLIKLPYPWPFQGYPPSFHLKFLELVDHSTSLLKPRVLFVLEENLCPIKIFIPNENSQYGTPCLFVKTRTYPTICWAWSNAWSFLFLSPQIWISVTRLVIIWGLQNEAKNNYFQINKAFLLVSCPSIAHRITLHVITRVEWKISSEKNRQSVGPKSVAWLCAFGPVG